MDMKRWCCGRVVSQGLMTLFVAGWASCSLTPDEELGARLFTDPHLSLNRNQACSACHSPETGGTGPDSEINGHGAVYEGSVSGRFGNRKPPAASYATYAPLFDYTAEKGFVGGNFWDGRATGWKLGNPAADQAQGPFLNPAEQALPDAAALVKRVCNSSYARLFRQVWGNASCNDVEAGFASIAKSIMSIEGSDVASPFNAKYDLSLDGRAKLNRREQQGLALFKGKAQCSTCHVESPDGRPLFTDFGFDNLGIPRNPENPFYRMDAVLVDGQPLNKLGPDWVDPGLAGFLSSLTKDTGWRTLPYVTPGLQSMSNEALTAAAEDNLGKHRVPTLRNVDKRPHPGFVKAYGHNGYFKSLKSIVHFYNTRDVRPKCSSSMTDRQALAAGCWPEPEVSAHLNRTTVGNLGLSEGEEEALVAFLSTLSDESPFNSPR